MNDEDKVKDCLDYFLASGTLTRLLEGFYEKYRSFGSVRGSVQLRSLGDEGIEALEGLTGKNFHGRKSATISAEKIQKCLDSSCYAGVTLDELVALWSQGKLKSKKQERQENEEQYAAFFGRLVREQEGTVGGQWLLEVLEEHGEEERILRRRFKESSLEKPVNTEKKLLGRQFRESTQSGSFSDDAKSCVNSKDMSNMQTEEKVLDCKMPEQSHADAIIEEGDLRKEMEVLMAAINSLPVWTNSYEYLPIFAAKVSGDPHYFDHKEKDTYLLYYAIRHVLHQETKWKMPLAARERHELLLMAGIIVDPVSNDAMVYGLRAWSDGEEHVGIRGFCERGEPLSITLSTIMRLDRVQCRGGQVYVVENPTVFARLVEEDTKAEATETISAVCGKGQPNQAVLQLLDRISWGNATIYYNGDYDPEGLGIAQRLKNRYGEKLVLWHYTEADYQQALSDKPVAASRMKMMDRLTSPELVRIAELIRETGRAGYQESVELYQ